MDNLVGHADAAEIQMSLDHLLQERLKAAKDEFLPAEQYIQKWGYKVNSTGTLPTAS
jgi:hypothetical protein